MDPDPHPRSRVLRQFELVEAVRAYDPTADEALLNRAGTTFRKLPEDQKQGLDEARAMALMLAQPSMIKRPVLTHGDKLIIGFDPARYSAALKA